MFILLGSFQPRVMEGIEITATNPPFKVFMFPFFYNQTIVFTAYFHEQRRMRYITISK